jgi:hypothetical protein
MGVPRGCGDGQNSFGRLTCISLTVVFDPDHMSVQLLSTDPHDLLTVDGIAFDYSGPKQGNSVEHCRVAATVTAADRHRCVPYRPRCPMFCQELAPTSSAGS